jgi:D-3-phosphoglycerate dehydrogenase
MSKMKVLIADKLAPQAIPLLEKGGIQVDDRPGIEAAELQSIIADFDGLIVRSRTKVTADLINAANNLKVIGRAGVGVDHIDLQAAKAKGIAVVNTPTSTSLSVAEHTMALMLAIVRRIPQADSRMKSGEWPKKGWLGSQLSGKVLGIVGIGNIGSQVAKRAAAFNMRVVAYDPYLKKEVIESRGAQAVKLDELYKMSDVITFHLALLDSTKGLVNADALAKMKPGVFIIHAARGGVIVESALLEAIKSGQVAGAGLDVFEIEPPGASDLIKHPNVIATPHIAAQTDEAQIFAAEDVAVEVSNALNDKAIRWPVA